MSSVDGNNQIAEAEPEGGDYIDKGEPEIKIPKYCLFHNFQTLLKQCRVLTDRTYELPYRWYFITFAPFNKNYERDIEWYKTKGFDHCRKKVGKMEQYIMTRETNASKVHINIVCVVDRELRLTNTNRYSVYCEPCIDRRKAVEYILKESKKRYFENYIDIQKSL